MKPEEFQRLMDKMRAPKGTPEGARPNLVNEITSILDRWGPHLIQALAGKQAVQGGNTQQLVANLFQSLSQPQIEQLSKILNAEQMDLLMKIAGSM